ncbi:DUF885 domain-containing protein [Cryobacterium psychrophilum]|uniref:DUF885 domain-containing protein n=1 Tax=Cryobacterium psychrophilum TaxID=41988 RepID=A0A4Y8KPB1_9MICO|nr:DUF885 domain-containing protein [Cryobacterium psychrophilum]TDW28591.1 uncharacterized protein (DUF885 family) [Cryobacterium psychrophilum]TFD80413.1 DUF885 domain-containing protein [Cryobacterium psychrophilum]
MTQEIQRPASAIDQIAEDWVDALVDLDPTVGTYIGRSEGAGRFGDFSPAGQERFVTEATAVIARLDAASDVDSVDTVTRTDLRSTLALQLESSEQGLHLRDLNVIASPAQGIREIFDLMPIATVADWSNISSRLGSVPAAVDGYIETLRLGIEKGVTPAKRQVREVLAQTRRHQANDGFFAHFAADAALDDGNLPASLAKDLNAGARASAAAYRKLGDFLSHELKGAATEQDAIGRDLYSLASRGFLGATIDLDETYEWGIEELARMTQEQEGVADQIKPGASVHEAIAFLDTDPSRKLHGTKALQEWMQKTSDNAVAELSKSQFDIPDEIKTIECMIAPTQEGGIYYTGPTDDFSRPGRMWWSVPVGVTEFDTWRELTTVFHEGVPGHHLQIGQAVYNRRTLNTWRRQLAGTSGHAEGWALYAERLMEQLGYLDDPADRFGMLDGQRMRAARVVLDIGVHLGKKRPDGNGIWTGEYALEFLGHNVNMNEGFVKFEVNRYLGWPGQAPSYKVGQRIWEELRDSAAARGGTDFSIKDFHREALNLGGVGLDTLRSALLL